MQVTDTDLDWAAVLSTIQSQMDRRVYDELISKTRLVSANGVFVIEAPTEDLRVRLERYQAPALARAIAFVLDCPVEAVSLEFVAQAEQARPDGPTPDRAEFLLNRAQQDVLDFDVYREGGYSPMSHYIVRFWGAYLGSMALQVWMYIRSFYPEPQYLYDSKAKGYVLNPKWTPWTPVRQFTPSTLARAIKSQQGKPGNRKRITGAWRTCERFAKAAASDEPWGSCRCLDRAGEMVEVEPDDDHPDGYHFCHYWDAGIMDQLAGERIGLIRKIGDPNKPRTIFYQAQIYQPLPLLVPAQAGQLNELTQIEHLAYLRDHQVDLDAWKSFTEASLLHRTISWSGATLPY